MILGNAENALAPAILQQAHGYGVADELFEAVPQRPRAELRVKALSHEKRQDFRRERQPMPLRRQIGKLPLQHQPGDFHLGVVVQPLEHEFFRDAGKQFGPQPLAGAGEHMALHRGEGGMLPVHQFRRADVGREDDIVAAQVQRRAVGDGDAGGIKDLQEHIHDARVRLFDFVEQQRAVRGSFDDAPEHSGFVRRRAEQQAKGFLRLVFGHVEAEQPVIARQIAGEDHDGFRFSDAGRPEQQEAAFRTGIGAQAKLAATENGRDARQRGVLSANRRLQMAFEIEEAGAAVPGSGRGWR